MTRPPLVAWSLFAAVLAAAGLPIYIHAPAVFAARYGADLAVLGAILAGLRLLDVVQDPLLGWVAGRWRARRGLSVAVGLAVLSLSLAGLFAVPPPIAPVAWFALTLTGLFSAYSFLTITFYAQGVSAGHAMGAAGHTRLATWRETGALLGVCAAAVAPTALLAATDAPFAAFAAGFGCLALIAGLAMRGAWSSSGSPVATAAETEARLTAPSAGAVRTVLSDPLARRLLLIALINAAPVAITATLFLFFVEARLAAPAAAGPFLVLFFLSAAGAAPVWGRIAGRVGDRRALLAGMALAVVAFPVAATLGPGDLWLFAAVCVATGAATGADLTLLPAIFARRMDRIAPDASMGFGLWSFVSKLSLALAAGIVLPALSMAGFRPGEVAGDSALRTLALSYSLLPCALKLGAIALLLATTFPTDTPEETT